MGRSGVTMSSIRQQGDRSVELIFFHASLVKHNVQV
jgi:hypothetical protein